jgi:ketosteroid isomerase-like protein
MLKRRTILFVMTALLAGSLVVYGAGAEDEIRQAEKNWASAVVSRDYAVLNRVMHDGLIYAHSTGIIESKGDYIGKLKSNTQRYDAIDHRELTVKVYGDAAVAHSKIVMKGQSGGRPFDNQLMMIHLWVKEGGAWRLVAHQTTELR